MIDAERLLAWSFPEIEHSYSQRDTMLYALALGIGRNPCDPQALRFVEDTAAPLLALPTMAVVIGFPGSWMQDPATGIDFARIVHGEEELLLHHPLPAAAIVIARHKVVKVVDKGPGRGATITYDKDLFLRDGGTHLATVRHTTFARGDGGFSGVPVPQSATPTVAFNLPDRAPDDIAVVLGLPQQALLYRLCGDRNPLHSDPATARAAGFDRPILHGLCTFGMAADVLLSQWAGGDPARLASLRARFSKPVFPGETLLIESWREGREIQFRVLVRERDAVVLNQGYATLNEELVR